MQPSPGTARSLLQGARILVVDDDAVTRTVVFDLLTGAGAHAIACTNAREAVAAFLAHAPIDLLVVDIVMPEMLGTTLVEVVRRIHPDVPVLYISAKSVPPTVGTHTAFLAVPFSDSELCRAVEELLAED